MSDCDAALQKKAANLIDHCGPLADQARPDPVQGLQIQLLVGLGGNKASCRPLHRLGPFATYDVQPQNVGLWGHARLKRRE